MAENALELTRTPRAEVPAAETPKPEALFGLATGVVVVSALYLAREVLIPITLAVFLTFFLAPIVKLLQRARLPKVAAVAVSVVAGARDHIVGRRDHWRPAQIARRRCAAISDDGDQQVRDAAQHDERPRQAGHGSFGTCL